MRNYEGLCGPRKTWEDGKLPTPLRRYTPPFWASVAMGIAPLRGLLRVPKDISDWKGLAQHLYDMRMDIDCMCVQIRRLRFNGDHVMLMLAGCNVHHSTNSP